MGRALPVLSAVARAGALALALVLAPAAAQPFTPPFHRLTVDGGLPHNAVSAVVQDQQGYVWVGTADGLARFDGYTPEPFLHNPASPTSVSGNHVRALLLARDGALWVGTAAGLDRFDPLHRRFLPYRPRGPVRPPVAALAEDARGRIWIGHAGEAAAPGGLSRLDVAARRFTRLPVGGARVVALAAAPDGSVWAGGPDGLLRFDAEGRPARLADGARTLDVRALLADADGAAWVGTRGGGLRRVDATGVETAAFLPGTGTGLPSPFVTSLTRGSDGAIWVTTAGPAPAADGALCRFVFKAFECTAHRRASATSLPAGAAHVAFQDRNGVLWVGTDGGLAWTDLQSRLVPHYAHDPADAAGLGDPTVTAFLESGKSVLWVGTARGLDRFDRERLRFDHLRHRPGDLSSLSSDDVRALAPAAGGGVWVGTAAGLDLLDPATGRFRRWPAPDGVSLTDVRVLHAEPEGVLWVGTAGGLVRLDPATGAATAFRPHPRDPASLPRGRITALLPDPDRPALLWVGTEGGLARLDTRTGRAVRFPAAPRDPTRLADDAITALAARPGERGVIWVGTDDGALARLDTRTGRVVRFEPPAGFPGRTLFGLVADADGALWASAREGLVRIAPGHLDAPARAAGGHAHDEACYHVYDLGRGVQSRQFSPGAAYRTAMGELAFGGINGFNFFAASDLRDNRHAPAVLVTGMRAGGRPVAPGPDGPVALPFPYARAVRLPFDHNDLAFDFVALHHGRPSDNRYEVQLGGFDERWLAVGAQRSVAYANVPPGAYTFRVRASNGDGVWTPVGLALPVTIAPPWWATWWARTLGLLLAGVAVAGAYRWRVRNIHAQNRRLARAVTERTAELRQQKEELRRQKEEAHAQAALLADKNRELETTLDQLHTAQVQLVQAEKLAGLGRLTAGIAHEIKNPLNFVTNFAHLSQELAAELRTELEARRGRPVEDALGEVEPLLDDLAMNAAKIAEHGRRADRIVRNMLLHARGVSGERSAVDLHALLDEAAANALAACAPRGASGDGAPAPEPIVVRDYDPAVPRVEAIAPALHRAVLNLVENAAYAVCACAARGEEGYAPTIRLTTRREGAAVRVTIADNGDGVPEAARARLFEPFFTTKPTGEGTGLGLSIAHDIVQGHGGTLALAPCEEGGAAFTLTLPLGSADAPAPGAG